MQRSGLNFPDQDVSYMRIFLQIHKQRSYLILWNAMKSKYAQKRFFLFLLQHSFL